MLLSPRPCRIPRVERAQVRGDSKVCFLLSSKSLNTQIPSGFVPSLSLGCTTLEVSPEGLLKSEYAEVNILLLLCSFLTCKFATKGQQSTGFSGLPTGGSAGGSRLLASWEVQMDTVRTISSKLGSVMYSSVNCRS